MKRFITIAATSILASIAASTQMAPAQTQAPQPGLDQATLSGDDFRPANATRTPAAEGSNSHMKALLDELEYRYQEEDSGSLKVILRVAEDRTQAVWISASAHKLGDVEIQEVISPGYLTEEALSGEVATQLLEDTHQKKLGAWETTKSGDTTIGLFVAKISADSSAEMLRAALLTSAWSADQMEAQLMPDQDRF